MLNHALNRGALSSFEICNRSALLIYYSRCDILLIPQYTFLIRIIFSRVTRLKLGNEQESIKDI